MNISPSKAQPDAVNHTDGQDELFLVDGSGFIFRAFFALPPLTNPQGVPVGAVLGFTNMLVKLLQDLHAPYIAVVFDAARKNFRNDIYAAYKATRDDTPPDLIPQFPLIREATEAFDIPALEMEGYEADDLIATYARLAVDQGLRVTIVSSDKDLMQLVTDKVRLYDPMKSAYIGPEEVRAKFGVAPDRVIDVQALAGDSVDNVPGVPGIGIKTASALIEEYGDLETLLSRAHEIKQQKRREKLIDHAEDARVSYKLVRLEDHAPVTVPIESLKARNPDSPALRAFLDKQGFRSVHARLGQSRPHNVAPAAGSPAKNTDHAPQNAPQDAPRGVTDLGPAIAENQYTLINDVAVLRQWMEQAAQKGLLAIDTETTSLTPAKAELVGISIAIERGKAAYIPLGHTSAPRDLLSGDDDGDNPPQLSIAEVSSVMKEVLEDDSIIKIGHNMKYDWQMLAKHDLRMTPVHDTMLMSYVLDGTTHGHGMDELSQLYFGHKPIAYKEVTGTGKAQIGFDRVKIADALNYAAEDADITLRLYHVLEPRLVPEKMKSVYELIERPMVQTIAGMELAGIKVDPKTLQVMSRDFAAKIAELETQIHSLAGTTFNIGSPKQLGEILFDQMNLKGSKKTKSGTWATDVDVLEKLAALSIEEGGHPIVAHIMDWRQLSKLKSTYTDALQTEINPLTGRVHTSFSLAATSTGRLASSEPNLQNIPIRTEEGRKIRTAFVAQEGYSLISVDYSQVELRLVAEIADIPALKAAFRDGRDIHALTASEVFGIPLDAMTSEIRRRAKAINFGIIYGISAFGLAKQLGCPVHEAKSYIETYFTRFPQLLDYMEQVKEEARAKGYVETLFGRKCVIGGIRDANQARRAFAERQAINAPIQGTAADIMKLAMTRIPAKLAEAGLDARLLLQVHDELILECKKDQADQCAKLVCSVMEGVTTLGVPLIAEAGIGDDWSQAH